MYGADRRDRDYFDGVAGFVKAAAAYRSFERKGFICCPCVDCKNQKQWRNVESIRTHLLRRGFMPGYTCWTEIGEVEPAQPVQELVGADAETLQERHELSEEDEAADGTQEINDSSDHSVVFSFEELHVGPEDVDLHNLLRDAKGDLAKDADLQRFDRLIQDSTTPLYPGSKEEHTKLHTVLTLLQMKASNGWSDKSFTELLRFLSALLPNGNVLPSSTYQAKQVVCPLGLEVQKIHACPNDCMLYHKEMKDRGSCVVCKASRFKMCDDADPNSVKKSPPAKVVWYFPIIPRLKRLFANAKNAELLRWHAEKRKNDGMLRHPADSAQWRNIDARYKKHFSREVRNIRFGLSTDGMNPFGDMGSRHSTWPVTLCVYNLPPWLCMKRKYIMMPLLIQGPRQPGNDIDVYLRPLVDDLLLLWNEGVRVWDGYRRESFMLRALLFVTINDYLTLGNLAGQTTKGRNGCVQCLDETCSRLHRRLQG